MTDREKVNQIYQQIEKLKDSNPLAAQFFNQLIESIKPQIEKALNETQSA